MTNEEIKEEIIELYGATQALNEAMNFLHALAVDDASKGIKQFFGVEE